MKITVLELKEKAELIQGIDSTINDKLSYAIKKNGQKITLALKSINESYEERIQDINIDHAAQDDRGVLILNDKGGYQYKPEQAKKRLKAIRQATSEYDSQVVEIDFFLSPACARILELDDFVIEELSGIIFDPAILSAED